MIFGILTDPAAGGTFLNWTLHYLSGHSDYFSVTQDQLTAVSDNPLTSKNAHGFKPNQPIDSTQVSYFLDKLKNVNSNTFHTIYFHNFQGVNERQSTDSLIQSIAETTQAADAVVVLTHNQNDSLYFCRYNKRAGNRSWNSPSFLTDPHEQFADFIDYFFHESKKKFEAAGMTNIWDQREFLSLNLDHRDTRKISKFIKLSDKHYIVDCGELFNRFEFTVKDLFSFLGIEIVKDRWDSWKAVYESWRELHVSNLQFALYFDRIVAAIVENQYIDLARFKLDIVQEAAIQRELLYKHNLSLKTWQLDRFVDTQQLHLRLEENVYHTL